MAKKLGLILSLKIYFRFFESRVHKIVNSLIQKDDKRVLFVPHESCLKDGYDIINWTGDNALCLAHYMIDSDSYRGYSFVIIVDYQEKVEEYSNYCKSLNSTVDITFVNRKSAKQIRKLFYKSKYAFVSSSVITFNSRTSSQIIVDLNYFTPFKNDYPYNESFRRMIYRTRKCFDYVITTAHLPSRIQALDLGLPLNSFLDLGFPRNDIFYRENSGEVLRYVQKKFFQDTQKIIMFTPTFRDYEKDKSLTRDLFGYSSFDYDGLEDVLSTFHAVIIVKMHTLQVENVDISAIKQRCKHIILFNELNCQYSLYQCLAEASCLITDYTSVYFDYLHKDKPVIFNFYDVVEYTKLRGLSYYPIESFIAGSIVKTNEELKFAIESVLKGEDPYYNQRQILKRLFDSHYDGLSAKRICERFFLIEESAEMKRYGY